MIRVGVELPPDWHERIDATLSDAIELAGRGQIAREEAAGLVKDALLEAAQQAEIRAEKA